MKYIFARKYMCIYLASAGKMGLITFDSKIKLNVELIRYATAYIIEQTGYTDVVIMNIKKIKRF